MGEAFIGEWKLVSSENFDELLKKLEVVAWLRKIGAKTKPRIRFAKSADHNESELWEFVSVIPLRTHRVKFKLGEVFYEDELFKDRRLKMVFALDGDKFVQTYLDDNNQPICQVTREIMPNGQMKTVCSSFLFVCLLTRLFYE